MVLLELYLAYLRLHWAGAKQLVLLRKKRAPVELEEMSLQRRPG
jgi:hypothetical protein